MFFSFLKSLHFFNMLITLVSLSTVITSVTGSFVDEPCMLHFLPLGSMPRRSIYPRSQAICIAPLDLPTYTGTILLLVSVRCMFASIALCFSCVICPSAFNPFSSNFFFNYAALKFRIVIVPSTISSYFGAVGSVIHDLCLKSGEVQSMVFKNND